MSRPQGDEDPAAVATATVGQRLRQERERQKIGLRELARRVGVSASLISQIELGRATPSVGTLYTIVNELSMSLDELFFDERPQTPPRSAPAHQRRDETADDHDPSHPPVRRTKRRTQPAPDPDGPLVRSGERQSIHLGSGVTWERMSPPTDHGVDFLYVVYEVGGASAPERSLIRHGGREYGHLLEGRLAVTVGFDTYELEPGDSIAFDSTTPHRLFNVGDVPAKALWFVIGRDDTRVTRNNAAAD
ncbi:helix-turn-helix domain-containing protein [Solirubrobacter soli]|uniref:helix-turn-helix domain-containing protein n=1 Tax=Solirubrobacter soli TaxID=363832 RepID=UPI0004032A2F|nr:cupin domain-containing protein [Solirubrobacter soli]